MREYFEINGYWKDNKEFFTGLIVTNFDDVEENGVYSEDDIFYFGLDEFKITELITEKENSIEDFVITSYTRIIQ